MKKEMKAKDVISLYAMLESIGIKIWIDGGWAVDALLGKQTRSHDDLDIAIEHKNLAKLKEYLESHGYAEIERADDKKWDLVMGDKYGHEIDIHAFTFDNRGKIIRDKYWDGYERNALNGSGIIDGKIVRCASLEHLMKTHDETKRKFKDTNYVDLKSLRKKFG